MADYIIITETALHTKALSVGVNFTDLASPKNYSANPNYCPTKNEITTQVVNSKILGTYSSNLLVCDKDVIIYSAPIVLTALSYDDVPASGAQIGIKTNPSIKFKTSTHGEITTTFPLTTYGTWTFNKYSDSITLTSDGKISATNLLNTVKVRTSLGYVNCKFIAKDEYGGWEINTNTIVYLALNEICAYEEVLNLEYPPISYSCHGDVNNSGYDMGIDDVDPMYRKEPIFPSLHTLTLTKLIYSSGYQVTSNLNNYISSYSIYNGNSFSVSSNSNYINIIANGTFFTYTSNLLYAKVGVWIGTGSTYYPRICTTLGTNSDRNFNITVSAASNVKSRLILNSNYYAGGTIKTIILNIPSLTKTFTLWSDGVITVNNSVESNKYIILCNSNNSYTGGILRSKDSTQITWTDQVTTPSQYYIFGIIFTGTGLSTMYVRNKASMPIAMHLSGNEFKPEMQSQKLDGYFEVISIVERSSNTSEFTCFPSLTLHKLTYRNLNNINIYEWVPKKDYEITCLN